VEQISFFFLLDTRCTRASELGPLGRADQREIFLERQREDDATVAMLKRVAVIGAGYARHNDVAAFHQPDCWRRSATRARHEPRHVADPWARRVDYGARPDAALLGAQPHHPKTAVDAQLANGRACHYQRSRLARRDGVEHDEPRVI